MYRSSGKRCTWEALRASQLIPEYLFQYYECLRDSHGGLKKLFAFLIGKFYRNKARFYRQIEISTTISYQEDGLDLHRENFFPIEWDWVEMILLANSQNMSICSFFVFLLRLEMAGALELKEKSDEVPPDSQKITLHQSITRYSIPKFTRILYMRVQHYYFSIQKIPFLVPYIELTLS